MKFDLSKFRKVKATTSSTTLKHPEGHTITIAHKSLAPKMREQLASLPMSDGGEVPENEEQRSPPTVGGIINYPGADKTVSTAPKNPKKPVKLAKGGEINLFEGEQVPEEALPASKEVAEQSAPEELPSVQSLKDQNGNEAAPKESAQASAPSAADLETQHKRELYNYAVANLNPESGGNPRVSLGPAMTFGPNGEAPKNFDPGVWNKVEQAYDFHKKGQQDADAHALEASQTAAITENKARSSAGLPNVPVPTSPQNQAPVPTPPTAPNRAPAGAPQAQSPAPSDPYGTQAYYDNYSKGLSQQQAGLAQEAQATSAQGQAEAQDLQNNAIKQQQQVQTYQNHLSALEQERQDHIHDIQNQKIDPNHYMSSLGTGQKIATGIGLILGGLGGGLTGQGNPVLQFINNQIDRDVQAQRANLGKSENLLTANMRQFGNLRDASDMTRVMQSDYVSNQLKEEAAKAKTPLAQANLLKAAGQLEMQAAPVMSQIAMRQSLLSGMKQGQIAPEQVIRMIVPQGEQAGAYKELKDAQQMVKTRDNLLSAFDQLVNINTVGNRALNPIQAKKQIDAIKASVIPGLSKETAGRFTEQDSKIIADLFDTLGTSKESSSLQRSRLLHLADEKMNFPMLKAWGIDMGNQGRYNIQGAPKIRESAPVLR